ncbi:hypothetical protein Acsp03_23120 [Actinomadura sp. NBRC 104412]|nr:hypothetical protein Acsp03_23120 [Actinomadura sp. NBRC 104412]
MNGHLGVHDDADPVDDTARVQPLDASPDPDGCRLEPEVHEPNVERCVRARFGAGGGADEGASSVTNRVGFCLRVPACGCLGRMRGR